MELCPEVAADTVAATSQIGRTTIPSQPLRVTTASLTGETTLAGTATGGARSAFAVAKFAVLPGTAALAAHTAIVVIAIEVHAAGRTAGFAKQAMIIASEAMLSGTQFDAAEG